MFQSLIGQQMSFKFILKIIHILRAYSIIHSIQKNTRVFSCKMLQFSCHCSPQEMRRAAVLRAVHELQEGPCRRGAGQGGGQGATCQGRGAPQGTDRERR